MKDSECIEFLQWALPRMGLRWAGFRKVRRQVCKRISRRMRELDIADLSHYQRVLESDADEWRVLDGFCRITISRFLRDRKVYEQLAENVLPELAARSQDGVLRAWSAGCGGGEEPYSLAFIWRQAVAGDFPGITLQIVATDTDDIGLARAAVARYSASSLKEVPISSHEQAFTRSDGHYVLKPEFRRDIEFRCEDIRRSAPTGPFDLVLCRNLAFTYFDLPTQHQVLARIHDVLAHGGVLVIGAHEQLPGDGPVFNQPELHLPFYWKEIAQ